MNTINPDNMKRLLRFIPLILLAVSFSVACDPAKPEESFEFKVTASDGSALSGVQTLAYDSSLTLSFTAKSVAGIETSAPAGWTVDVSMSGRHITISSPSAKDASAAESGTVEIVAKANSGKTITENVQVKVTDAAVLFSINDVSGKLEFVYAQTRSFSFEASNVEKLEAVLPAGWTFNSNLEAKTLSISAPERGNAAAELEGTVKITPVSARGNAGESVNIPVSVKVNAPTIVFSPSGFSHVDFGSKNVLSVSEMENVEKIELLQAPKGWSCDFTLPASSFTLNAPAEGGDYDGEGSIIIQARSASGDTHEYSIPVSVKGINNKTEFLSLVKAYNALAEGANPSSIIADYVWKGELLLNTDLDLGDTGTACFVTRDFTYSFNGKGHTVTLNYSGDAEAIGFFSCVAEPGKVSNINFAGSIVSSHYDVKLAVVTCISKGGKFENINSSVDISQNGTNGAETDSPAKGFLGVIAADEQGNGSYTNCRNSGPIKFSNVKYMGGLIGDIWDNTKGTVSGCANTAPITGEFKSYAMNDALAGGVVGNTIGSDWHYTNSYNSGAFKYGFNKNGTGIRALGGFAGTVFGHYDSCYNTGDVTDSDGLDASFGTRRIGGFGGAAWLSNDCVFTGNNCYNTGNVSGICNYIGGFVGILEETEEEAKCHRITNCYNTGNVSVLSNTAVSDAFGGLAGTLYNLVIVQNCRNEGKVIGVSKRCAGGLIGRAADAVVIQNCTNSGDLYVGAVEVAQVKAYSPVAGGICGIAGENSKVSILQCNNTGKITAMTVYQQGVQSTYASEAALAKVHDPGSAATDQTNIDQATKDNSAGATIVWIPKKDWSENTIRSWIK